MAALSTPSVPSTALLHNAGPCQYPCCHFRTCTHFLVSTCWSHCGGRPPFLRRAVFSGPGSPDPCSLVHVFFYFLFLFCLPATLALGSSWWGLTLQLFVQMPPLLTFSFSRASCRTCIARSPWPKWRNSPYTSMNCSIMTLPGCLPLSPHSRWGTRCPLRRMAAPAVLVFQLLMPQYVESSV